MAAGFPPMVTLTGLTVGVGPVAAAPEATAGVTAPRPPQYITTVSPAFTGYALSTICPDGPTMIPCPVPDWSLVKIPGCVAATVMDSGTERAVDRRTVSWCCVFTDRS